MLTVIGNLVLVFIVLTLFSGLAVALYGAWAFLGPYGRTVSLKYRIQSDSDENEDYQLRLVLKSTP